MTSRSCWTMVTGAHVFVLSSLRHCLATSVNQKQQLVDMAITRGISRSDG